jgi:type IV pilus assembly protein PilM
MVVRMASTRVALEITEESVRAIEITRGRKPSIVAWGEVLLPPDAAKDSEVLDPGAVAVALGQLWTGSRIGNREVTVAIGSRRILVREYTTQALAPDMLRKALAFQVQDLLPVPVSQAVLDFYPVSQVGDQVTGLLVAAVAENVEGLISVLDRVKVRTHGVDLAAFGLARLAASVAEPDQTVAMIHIGDHTTHVVVATAGVPQFVRIIPIDVATRAGRREESSAVVEESFIDIMAGGVALPTTQRTRAAIRSSGGSADPAVNDLVARLRSTISFFSARPDAKPVSGIFVSGAGYAAPGVADALSRAFEVSVQPVRVTDFAASKTPIEEDAALNLVTALGVIWGEGN